ncbi:MAG TPA: hypothetical protein VEP29_10485, partial [Desulfatiglandales bacterium]|nr:hypothetical protein [Desulfatiglandales bacterium]
GSFSWSLPFPAIQTLGLARNHPLAPTLAPLPGTVPFLRVHPGARCTHPRLRLFGPSGAIP